MQKYCPAIDINMEFVFSITQKAYEKCKGDRRYRSRMSIMDMEGRQIDKFIVVKKEPKRLLLGGERKRKRNRLSEMSAEEVLNKRQGASVRKSGNDKTHEEHEMEAKKNDAFCMTCMKSRIVNPKEATATCPGCGISITIDVGEIYTEYREGTSRITTYTYRPMGHFIDHLAAIQGMGSSNIPQDVMDIVREDIKIYRIQDRLTVEDVYGILKKKKLSTQYCNAMRIWSIITGKEGPRLNEVERSVLCGKFKQIEEVWTKCRPGVRKNIISYHFIIHQLCKLLGGSYMKIIPHLRLLKSRDKLEKQQEMWKIVCDELGWEYMEINYLESDCV
jgi:hypothetical protein